MGKQLKIAAWRWGAELMIQLAKIRHRICQALSYPWFRESDEAKTSPQWLLYCEYKRDLSITLPSMLLGLVKVSPKVLTSGNRKQSQTQRSNTALIDFSSLIGCRNGIYIFRDSAKILTIIRAGETSR
jgi:hypothetical protein